MTDRSKYKATSVAAGQDLDKQVEQLTQSNGQGSKNAGYLDIKEGTGEHVYRIYPPTPDDGGIPYAEAKGIHWLPQLVAEKNAKGEFEKDAAGNLIKNKWANRPVFNARLHGDQESDVIEEYIKFAEKLAVDMYGVAPTDKQAIADKFQFLEPIKGSPFVRGVKAKYQGIFLKQTWVMYVDEVTDRGGKVTNKFGRLEIGRAIKDRLNKIAASESANEPMGTDPFTDLDDGKTVKIIYNSKATKAVDYYSTDVYAPTIPNSGGRVKLYPISDESLKHFSEQKSLFKMFRGVYTTDTFDSAVAGLRQFDKTNELGVFEFDEFKEIVHKLRSKLPTASGESSTQELETATGDQFDTMDRDELKDFIHEFKLGIITKTSGGKTMNDDEIRDEIRKVMEVKESTPKTDRISKVEETKPLTKQEPSDLPWDKNGDDIMKTVESKPLEKEQPKISASERLAALRNKK